MMDSRLRQGDVIHEQSSNNAAGATVKSTGHPSPRSDLAVRDREGIPGKSTKTYGCEHPSLRRVIVTTDQIRISMSCRQFVAQ